MVYWRPLHLNLMQRTLARPLWSFADLNFLIVHVQPKLTEVAHVQIRPADRAIAEMIGHAPTAGGQRATGGTVRTHLSPAAGAIIFSRGVIKIIDLEAVKAMACQCYETFREQTSLVGAPAAQPRAGR